ncbi:hypothetical protein [Vibrio harveyi]|uniref:hypothetical protein n=1 Tax=Vibrio harveyi TaxID=669 RepID=UPI00238023E6|nr:hypothetical protein [Vibrio harveyi]
MNLNFYQVDTDTNDVWDKTTDKLLLVMSDIRSTDIPTLNEFLVLPVGVYLYRVMKVIRRIDEIQPETFITTDIDIILTPAIAD